MRRRTSEREVKSKKDEGRKLVESLNRTSGISFSAMPPACLPRPLVLNCLTMRDTLTISLPREMRREVARAAKRQKLTTSEYVRDAVRRKLWLDAFDETRRKLIPKARALGIYTDEDVFKIVS